jgi:ABC-type glycerol-3-phosphate transport system substrate-binding protein
MKKVLATILALCMLFSVTAAMATADSAKQLPKSENLYFDNGLEITGMGIHFNNYPTEFDGCYYFPAIQALTNATINIDWRVADNYATQLATTLASGKLPDIIVPGSSGSGVMNLVSEGAIIPLDDYIDLIPNIVAAVGEDLWPLASGRRPHLHHPTIVNVPAPRA